MSSFKQYADVAGCTLKIELISPPVKQRVAARPVSRENTQKMPRRSA